MRSHNFLPSKLTCTLTCITADLPLYGQTEIKCCLIHWIPLPHATPRSQVKRGTTHKHMLAMVWSKMINYNYNIACQGWCHDARTSTHKNERNKGTNTLPLLPVMLPNGRRRHQVLHKPEHYIMTGNREKASSRYPSCTTL